MAPTKRSLNSPACRGHAVQRPMTPGRLVALEDHVNRHGHFHVLGPSDDDVRHVGKHNLGRVGGRGAHRRFNTRLTHALATSSEVQDGVCGATTRCTARMARQCPFRAWS